MLPAQTGASPPDLCQEQLQASRALQGIPACSILQRTSAPRRCSGRRLAGQRSLLQCLWHTAALDISWLGGCCAQRLPILVTDISSPKALCASTCLAACLGTTPVPKSPWRSLFPEARHGKMLGCPHVPLVARSNKTRATLGVCCPHVGLISRGAHAGDALELPAANAMPLPAHSRPPF